MSPYSNASTGQSSAGHAKHMEPIDEMLRPPSRSPIPEFARGLNSDIGRIFAEHQPEPETDPSVHDSGTGFIGPLAAKAAQVGSLIDQCLADSVVLKILFRQALEGIAEDEQNGSRKHELRQLLRHIGAVFEQQIDRLAVRVIELGFMPEGTLAEATERCGFQGRSPGHRQQDGHIDAALSTLDVYCAVLREDQQTLINHEDSESADILADILSHMEQFLAEGRRLLAVR